MSSFVFALLRDLSSTIQRRLFLSLKTSDLVKGEGKGVVCIERSTIVGEVRIDIGGVMVMY